MGFFTPLVPSKQEKNMIVLLTPFENAQRWMGKNTFPILLLNDDKMIGEHKKTRMKMLYGCLFEKNEKEVFFRLTTFFRNKKNCPRNNFCMYCKAK